MHTSTEAVHLPVKGQRTPRVITENYADVPNEFDLHTKSAPRGACCANIAAI